MNWLQTMAVVLHVGLAFGIIGLVLLQRGKGADAGAGFGAGASGTVFGARGSGSFLSRTTAILATLFFLSSLGLSFLFSRGGEAPSSVVDQVPAVPAIPALPAGGDSLPSIPQPAPAPAGEPAPTAPTQP
jgi:preprotein translocase subunit SecG